jgi:sortase (surface protein transpeptidase)
VLIHRPAAITIAAGLMAITAGTAGLLLTRHSTPAMRPPPAGVATVAAPTGPIVAPSADPPRSPQPATIAKSTTIAKPVSLTIPLIGVETTLVKLGLAAGGELQVPSSAAVAGWYTGSPRPGAIGSAVIAGHVDSVTGPGVFYRLSELRAGDRVYVRRADGTTVEFRVNAVETYLKDYFPTAAVYGPAPDPELRLITCGGTFDYATGHYLSNIVVYATEVG